MKKMTLLIYLLFLLNVHSANSQIVDNKQINDSIIRPISEIGLFPKNEPDELYRIRVSGIYRFFATYTRMTDAYLLNPSINDSTKARSIFIGDDSLLPNLLFNISGRPSENTAWGFDLYMFQFLDGAVKPAYSVQVIDSLRPNVFNPLNPN
jgi:hypothetical protein